MSHKNDDEPPRLKVRARTRPLQLSPGATQPPPSDDCSAETATPNDDYRVGHKRPPRHSQFKPGQSGNRKGRPKGSRNWATIVAEAASRRRTIGVNGKKVRMCGREVIAEQMVVSAIKGDKAARRDFLGEMRLERQNADPTVSNAPEAAPSVSDEALLDDFVLRRTAKLRGEGDE